MSYQGVVRIQSLIVIWILDDDGSYCCRENERDEKEREWSTDEIDGDRRV